MGVLASHMGVLASHMGVLTSHMDVLASHMGVLTSHMGVIPGNGCLHKALHMQYAGAGRSQHADGSKCC
jgi:hypothetical protein